MKKYLKFLPLFILGLLGFIFWAFSSMVIIPRPNPVEANGFSGYPSPESFTVQTEDNLTLQGWYIKNPADSIDCAVVFSHGWGSNRTGVSEYFAPYWSRGCDIVVYDHRANGNSDGFYGTFTTKERQDLRIVTDWLKNRTGFRDDQIGWMGESWGAATVLAAGVENPEIAFIAADSPFKDIYSAVGERAKRSYGDWVSLLEPLILAIVEWRAELDVEETRLIPKIEQLEMPILLVHSQTDQATGSWQSVDIAKHLDPEKSVFHHTDWGSLHCQDAKNHPDKYNALVDSFFEEYLPNWP